MYNKLAFIVPVVIVALLIVAYWKWLHPPLPVYRQPLRTFLYPGRYGTGIPKFSPDNRTLAILTEPAQEPETEDYTGVMVDVETGVLRHQFSHLGVNGYFSPDGAYFYSLGKNGFVQCDMKTGAQQVLVHTKGEFQYLSHDLALLLVYENGYFFLYDTHSGKQLRRFTGAENWYGAALSHDSKRVAIASSDGTNVYKIDTGAEIAHLRTTSGTNPESAFSPDSTLLATVCDHHSVTLWETTHWTQVRTLPVENYKQVWNMYFWSNTMLVIGGQTEPNRHNINELWNPQTVRQIMETPGVFVAISKDEKRVAATDTPREMNSLAVYNLQSGRGAFRFVEDHNMMFHPAFSDDGTLLVECSNDNPATYKIWRVPR